MADLKIDENSLSMEMATQAANYLYIAEQAVKAEAVYETTKMSFEIVVANADAKIRSEAVTAGRKITEKQLEGEVTVNQAVKEARIRMIKAKAEKEMLRANREAWYSRKDMLIQMAIKERNEIDAITGTKVTSLAA